MSDDLVKRANLCLSDMQGRVDASKLVVFSDCIDRIEELEAKLAKAVEEAEKNRRAFAAQSRKLQAVLHIDGVRTTLAELTGGKDE